MSLSGNAKDNITIAQAVLEVASVIKELSPKGLEELAKAAYALPEAEEKKATAARDAIAQNRTVLASIEDAQEKLDFTSQEIDDKKDELERLFKKLDDDNRKSEAKKLQLEELSSQLSDTKKTLEKRERDLETAVSKLNQGNLELAQRQKEVEDYEAMLKDRADQLQALTKGL
jgi:chromosome segregation ATPase